MTPPPVDREGADHVALDRAAYLLACLRGRGFTVNSDGGRLVITPGSRLTEVEAGEVREYKALLLDLIGREPRCLPKSEWTAEDDQAVRLVATGAFQWWRPGLAEEHMTRTGRANTTENHHGEDESEAAGGA